MAPADLQMSTMNASMDELLSQPVFPPVKNTFIHFEGDSKGSSSRSLRRWRTDPEEPLQCLSSGLKADRTSTASLANSSDTGSTNEPTSEAEAEVEADGPTSEVCATFEGFNSPETTPRGVRDPWSSPEATHAAHLQALVPTVSSDGMFATNLQATPPQSTLSSTVPSSISSSPASSTYLDAAFNSLSADVPERPSKFLEGGYCFGFTLRLADDVGLGLDLVPRSNEALLVQRVLQNGAIAAWNKQCFDGTAKSLKAVWPGDTIVSVNDKTQYQEMMDECKHKMLLKITVFRAVGLSGAAEGGVPSNSWWSSTASYMEQHSREGERFHSCKKPVVLRI